MGPQATAPSDEAGLQGSPRIGAAHSSIRCGESGHHTACDQQSPSSLGPRPLGLVWLPHEHLLDEEVGIPCLDDSASQLSQADMCLVPKRGRGMGLLHNLKQA